MPELPEVETTRAGLAPHVEGRRVRAVLLRVAYRKTLLEDLREVERSDFESLAQAGSMLGTGAVIVIGEGTCMVDVTRRIARFFAHESCGYCAPCRVGTRRLAETLERVETGQGRPGDLDLLAGLCEGIQGRTFCPLGDAAAAPVRRSLELFRGEFEAHIRSAC